MIKIRMTVGALALGLLALTGSLVQAEGRDAYQVRADTSWGLVAPAPSPEAPEGPEGENVALEDTSWG